MTRDLPQFEFVLTAQDRRQAERIAYHIERQRQERNARENAAQKRREARA